MADGPTRHRAVVWTDADHFGGGFRLGRRVVRMSEQPATFRDQAIVVVIFLGGWAAVIVAGLVLAH
jgi:hypothetical protein